jgi:hypothetical protein
MSARWWAPLGRDNLRRKIATSGFVYVEARRARCGQASNPITEIWSKGGVYDSSRFDEKFAKELRPNY